VLLPERAYCGNEKLVQHYWSFRGKRSLRRAGFWHSVLLAVIACLYGRNPSTLKKHALVKEFSITAFAVISGAFFSTAFRSTL
jgi:hypothetical protein